MLRPQVKDHFHVEVVEPDTVFLLSEYDPVVLNGLLYTQLVPLLDGSRTVQDIIDALKGQAPFMTIQFALSSLEQKGYIAEASDALTPEIAGFWHSLGIDAQRATTCLQSTAVSVATFGSTSNTAESLIPILESLNIPISAEGQFAIALTDDYLRPELEAFNKTMLAVQKSWLLAKPVGHVLWIGPIFRPGVTGCWGCLGQRLIGNRPVDTFLRQRKGSNEPFPVSNGALSSSLNMGLNMVATEAAKWLASGQHEALEGAMFTFDLRTLEKRTHTLTRRPQCPYCGQPEYRTVQAAPIPIELTSQKKLFTTDGGHRVTSPEATLRKYERQVSPITGVVRSLEAFDGHGSDVIHVYTAGENAAFMYNQWRALRKSLRSMSAGKGMTDAQSKVSGLCEAIERYSGVFQGYEPRIKATLASLGSAGIHPNDSMRFSQTQYDNRDLLNRVSRPHNMIPIPFDESREVEWSALWSLTNHEFKYLPTTLCYYGYPLPKDHEFYSGDSNGSAAGNTKEEAIFQGFMELVERDSVAIWWYNRLRSPGVDIRSFDEPYFDKLAAYYESIGRDLWVLDITSDLGIPSFVALSCKKNTQGMIITGFGAHFDPKIAISRALTELNQPLPYTLQVEALGLENSPIDDEQTREWWKNATVANQPYLAPAGNVPIKRCSDYVVIRNEDLLDDLKLCVEIVKAHDMEVLVLDQTRPDIGLPVVKVFVPGLRHFWARLGPGRLYDVPVKQGWLHEVLREDQLNPTEMLL